jgi:RHS repeat-associated protein
MRPSMLDDTASNPPRRRPPYGIYAYTAREWDPETNLSYYRARYYDPKVGRFISEDPSGFGAGANFYAYADNSPTNRTDPFGLASVTVRKPRVVLVDPPRWACWNSQWGCVEPWDEYSAECTECGTLRITITMSPEVRVRKGDKYDFGPWELERPRDRSAVGQKSAIAHEMRHVNDYRRDMSAYSEAWEKDYGSWEECEKFRQYFLDSLKLIRSTFRRRTQSARD